MSVYPHPFSAGFWRDAAGEFKSLRKLTFAALMIAMCIILGYIPSIPVATAKITWGFLARSVCAWVCGPLVGLAFGFAEDILSFFLTGGGGGPFFPGYTITTMLGVFTYAIIFYRQKITLRSIFLAKLLTNIQNVLLGTLWTSILNGKAWLVLVPARALKNLIMLPVQTAMLFVLFTALLPFLRRMDLITWKEGRIGL